MFHFFTNDILREHIDIICVGILDDVIIFSAILAEHVKHVRTILEVLRKHQQYAKTEKCEFDKEEMTFVGFLLSKSGIGMDSAKVAATSLTWKGVRFTWSPATDAAFKQLQQAFTFAPVLHHYQPYLPITVEADASNYALGCILS